MKTDGVQEDSLLIVKNLKQYFQVDRTHTVKAVDDVSFSIQRGTTFAMVGESGSGKSTIGKSVIRLYDPTEGTVILDGMEISGPMTREKKRFLTGKMQMIFQDPMSSLNPRRKVLDIVAEGLDANRLYHSAQERREKVYDILEKVGLSREQADRYPHMFSGGQRQRIGIARAMIMEPELIIADECISALDVSTQAQVVNLMKEFQEERKLAYLFIAHDLAMAKYIADYVGVIHLGHFVETGTKKDIFEHPVHPYTKSLLSAVPEPNPLERDRKLESYDMEKMGIHYQEGGQHYLTDTHMVLGTEEQIAQWSS